MMRHLFTRWHGAAALIAAVVTAAPAAAWPSPNRAPTPGSTASRRWSGKPTTRHPPSLRRPCAKTTRSGSSTASSASTPTCVPAMCSR